MRKDIKELPTAHAVAINFGALLKENRLKNTPQRLAILGAIDELGHASIDEIYTLVYEKLPSISLATVYKNILAMRQNNLLSEIKAQGREKYEINKSPHVHTVCSVCGELLDVHVDNMSALLAELSQKQGFYIDNISCTFSGVCKSCQEKERRIG